MAPSVIGRGSASSLEDLKDHGGGTPHASLADVTPPCTPLLGLSVAFAAVTGILMGYDFAIAAVVLQPIQEDFNLCSGQFTCRAKDLFVSLVGPGAIVGAMSGGSIADWFGRRVALAASDFFIILAASLMALGQSFFVVLIGRFFVGMGAGIGLVNFSTYTSEISPPKRRGALVVCQELCQCIGAILAFLAAVSLGPSTEHATENAWRWLLGAAGLVGVVQGFGILLLPESPRWLMFRYREERAREVMRKLGMGSTADIDQQMAAIRRERDGDKFLDARTVSSNGSDESLCTAEDETAHSRKKRAPLRADEEGGWVKRVALQWREIRGHRKQMLMAVGCAVAGNLTFGPVVFPLSEDILRLAGVGPLGRFWAGLGIGLMKLFGVLLTMSTVDVFGRRRLLFVGNLGTCCCHLLLSVAFLSHVLYTGHSIDLNASYTHDQPAELLPPSLTAVLGSLGVLLFMLAWNVGWASMIYVVASELLPSRIRGVGMSMVEVTFWVLAFVNGNTMERLFLNITPQGTFLLYACLNALCFVLICVLPENTGKSLEDINAALSPHTRHHTAGSNDGDGVKMAWPAPADQHNGGAVEMAQKVGPVCVGKKVLHKQSRVLQYDMMDDETSD